MKRKILSFLLILTLLVSATPLTGIDFTGLTVSASEETRKSTKGLRGLQYTDEYIYEAYTDYSIFIFKYIGEAGEYIEIPSEIDGYTVEYIGDQAFSPYGSLHSPANNQEIPENESLNNLKEVSIPSTVKEIGCYAFLNCKKLEKVNFSEGLESIWWGAFCGCENITSFDFPSTLYYVCWGNFEGTSVTEVLFKKSNFYDYVDLNADTFSESKVVKCTFQSDGVRVSKNAFRNSVVEEVIFEGTITSWEEPVLYSQNNTVKKIVFKAGMPEGVCEILMNDYGYYLHTDITDGSIYFDKSPGNVNTFVSGDFVYTLDTEQQAIITKYTGAETDLTVPETIDGHPVVQIGGFAFANAEITSVKLPETIEKIGIYAFYNCNTLEEINTPQRLNEINGYAFCGCTNLEGFDVPRRLKYLGAYAFGCCESIESISIPDTVAQIHNGVFMNCKSLKEVEMSSNIRSIGISAFEGTSSLGEIDWSESLIFIDDRAFHSSGIKNIVLPSSLQFLGEYAFESSEIENAIINGNNLDIYWSFHDCLKLKTLELKNGVKSIAEGAFTNLPSLETVIIPETLESIGLSAFRNCPNINTIHYNAINCKVDYKLQHNMQTPQQSVFDNCAPKNIIIGDKVEYLGLALFMKCDSIESIKIPDTVITVDLYAFYGCDSLVSVEWNSERKIIGVRAFAKCPKLTDFNFNNIEKYHSSCFYGSGINKAQIGETKNETSSLMVIDEQAFMNCKNLAMVGIGGNVTGIETQAFADCTNLETAVIADSVEEIADDAFDGCDKLTIYCSETSYAYAYATANGIKVSTFVISAIPNKTYTGYAIKPTVTVSVSNTILTKDVDYSVSYSNNINVGQATVVVRGIGDYEMFSSRANFTIVTKNISKVSIADINDQKYTGKSVEPSITVTDNGRYLKEGKDYTVHYYNNVNQGVANAVITGIGNYSGTVTTTFEITELGAGDSFADWFARFISDSFIRIISFILSYFNR